LHQHPAFEAYKVGKLFFVVVAATSHED
jgi:hypothetical protein